MKFFALFCFVLIASQATCEVTPRKLNIKDFAMNLLANATKAVDAAVVKVEKHAETVIDKIDNLAQNGAALAIKVVEKKIDELNEAASGVGSEILDKCMGKVNELQDSFEGVLNGNVECGKVSADALRENLKTQVKQIRDSLNDFEMLVEEAKECNGLCLEYYPRLGLKFVEGLAKVSKTTAVVIANQLVKIAEATQCGVKVSAKFVKESVIIIKDAFICITE